MRIKVKFFGPLRDVAGGGEETLELRDGATTAALLETLVSRHPKLDDYLGEVKVAVNQKLAKDVADLKEGDEVALLPPVSGG